jgi:hypothetical protein
VRGGAGVAGGGQELEAQAEAAAGLVLRDAQVGGGLAVVAALEVGQLQRGAQRSRHGLDDVVGAGGDRGAPHLGLQLLRGARPAPDQGRRLGGAQPLDGEAVGERGDPGAQRTLPGVVGVGMLPDVREDVAGEAVGGPLVVEHAVRQAVHQRGEPVVQLAQGGGLAAREPLLHLAVPAQWCVPLRHAVPPPPPRSQPAATLSPNVVGTSDSARPFVPMRAPRPAGGDMRLHYPLSCDRIRSNRIETV